jgi:hypothetical protein
MDGRLRRHDVRSNRPGARLIACFGEHGCRGLIARRFDGEKHFGRLKFEG